jgi:hypothetical protein
VVTVAVERAAAWPPVLDDPAPATPDVSFLPPLLRRRCSPLTRMMLHVAHAACPEPERARLPLVFASRYGEARATVTLLENLARRQPLTASGFSHSVHNAQAALFSIATGNRQPASAVAGGPGTFGSAFLEALVAAHRSDGAALLVVADDPLPPVFARFQAPPALSYAVALLLRLDAAGLAFEAGDGSVAADRSTPEAVRFVRWLASTEPRLALGTTPMYTWTRRAPDPARAVSAGPPPPRGRPAAPPASA